jgi:hypothetical protein
MNADEPLFDSDPKTDSPGAANPVVRALIQTLVTEQSYAVLCVQGGGRPYGARVAFAFSEDLRYAVFKAACRCTRQTAARSKRRGVSSCDCSTSELSAEPHFFASRAGKLA